MTKMEIIDYLYENHVHADIKIEDMAEDLATEQKTGAWIEDDDEMIIWCSVCANENDFCTDFCPHCGARMVKTDD